MSGIVRRPALSHPLDSLADEAAPQRPTTAPAQPPKHPKTGPMSEPGEGVAQTNVRLPAGLRRELRSAAAGMTAITGDRWSQDLLVRQALEDFLPRLYAEHNDSRPFGRN